MTTLTLEKRDGIAIVSMNCPDQPQNVLSEDFRNEYETIFTDIAQDSSLKGMVFRSTKKDCFLAGADINIFQTLHSQEDATASSQMLHSMFQKIADLKLTTVAAIDGVCLGGGLELALVFDYRLASDNPATKVGVPEVQLGLLPGGGGTQRLSRLIDLPTALDMMLTGKQLNAKRCKSAGIVDDVVPAAILLDIAIDYARRPKPKRKQSFKNRLMKMPPLRQIVIAQARKQVLRQTKGKYPAPLKILEVINRGLGTNLQRGLKIEAEGFGHLLMTDESRQLVNIFFAVTDLKKDSGVDSQAKAKQVEHVGVLGAGLMGAGIAYVTIDKAKKSVRLKDISAEGLSKGIAYVGKIMDKKLARRRVKPLQHKAVMSKLTGSIDYRGFKNSDVVIEAVFEDVGLKQKMVNDIESLGGSKETIFATNTSALPIDDIAKGAKHPERVVGMHYFSPVEKMPLLEVVKGSQTADWVTATAVDLGKKQGKTVIVVNDGPGFYTTRILVPYCMEAVRLVLEGVAIEEVDNSMEAFGMPVGPIKLMDEVGIDVGAHIVKTLNEAFGDRIPLIDGMETLQADGRKGKKNGKGFYDYSDKSKGKQVDESIYKLMDIPNPARNEISREVIINRVISTMINEAAYCLEEGILRSARDGDIGAIFGLGFPPFLGGPFRYMDSMGLQSIVDSLHSLESEFGSRFSPAGILKELAADNQSFY